MQFPKIPAEKLLKRLEPPKGKIRMVLDTDTYNEIDDQFAVVYALKSPDRLQVEALYAAPFYNSFSTDPKDGMEKSYEEILRLLSRLDVSYEDFVYRGSTQYLPGADQPVRSEAAEDLVKRAMASADDDPLYVVAIGAITNVASAILLEPKIIEKIVVVWLGGHALQWPHTKEFNLQQDLHAARIVLDSGVPLVLLPCMGVVSHLLTTLTEIKEFVKDRGAIGDFLYEIYKNYHNDHFAYSKVIWDISTIAYLVQEENYVELDRADFKGNEWVTTQLIHSPILTDQVTWSFDQSRHLIRYANFVKRDPIFKDLFNKLASE